MTRTDLIEELEKRGYNNDAKATQQDLYTLIRRGQLFSDTNRLNAGWARGKYVIASYDDSNRQVDEYISQWVQKTQSYTDQTLCLEISQDEWKFYDYAGREIDYNIALPQQRGVHSLLKSSCMENGRNSYWPSIIAIKTKPFLLLAGISGTGKSRIVREFAFKSCPEYLQDNNGTTPGNYCMIEVKPNWHDSTELLGYYSRLGKEPGYQFTKFVKFLVKAKMFPHVPFFVCLDEMNLAPVEQYFAEILSILETRKTVVGEDGKKTIKTGAIIDAAHFKGLGKIGGYTPDFTDRDIYMKLYGIDTESDIADEVGKRTELTTEGLTLPCPTML